MAEDRTPGDGGGQKSDLPGFLPDGRHVLVDFVPHAKEIGMKLIDARDGEAWMSIPYDERLIGDPQTRVLHGGVVTTLLDNCCGVAVMFALGKLEAVATLDLRINYMRPATPDLAITAHAHCYRMTRNIAFTRATAYHDDPETPIATASGAFMIGANESMNASLGMARAAGISGAGGEPS